MFDSRALPAAASKPHLYAELDVQLRALLASERDFWANAANTAALLYHSLPDVNWAGFYVYRRGELVLGPFQGRPACVRIALGRGACGTAAISRETLVVPDVQNLPGHIACDPESRSEIVVPLLRGARVVGVLDVDSPILNRFDPQDREGLERLIARFLASSDAPEP